MPVPRRVWAFIGSLLFLVLAPGTVAGLIPYWLTGWRVEHPHWAPWIVRAAGTAMIAAGLAGLLDSFARFVFVGLGTPAPVALTEKFGASCVAYRKNVRRWWPRLRPWDG